MKMPNPIAIRFAKLIFSILSITVLGVIFAMISHDHKLLILSAGVAITGGEQAAVRVSRGTACPRAGQYS